MQYISCIILNWLEILYKLWHLYFPGPRLCAVSAQLYHDSENETIKTKYFLLYDDPRVHIIWQK